MPITIERKKELLRIIRDIGMPLTRIESEARIDGLAQEQVERLRQALEAVRSTIATHPERDPS